MRGVGAVGAQQQWSKSSSHHLAAPILVIYLRPVDTSHQMGAVYWVWKSGLGWCRCTPTRIACWWSRMPHNERGIRYI